MKIYGIKIRLEPDPRIPAFKRLRHERVEVSLKDVLLKGIHPESAMGLTGDWCQAAELLVHHLNRSDRRFPALTPHRLNPEVSAVRDGYTHDRRSGLARTLDQVETGVCFADTADYDWIVKLVRDALRSRWNRGIARSLLNGGRNGFTELRAFLKAKHPDLKISSYDALNDLDLAALLSVEDFMAEEQNLVNEALPCRNVRKPGAVLDLLDDEGRLRLRDRIEWFELTVNPQQGHVCGHVKYACRLDGGNVVFTPELADSTVQRKQARAFAREYRAEGGDYCFTVTVDRLQEIMDREQVALRFANVRYLERPKPLVASARFRKEGIVTYGIPWRGMKTGDEFRDALRAHGWKVAGKKSDLVRRTAELAAERLADAAPELDTWFGQHRYVRVPKGQTFPTPFPVLDDEPLKNLVLMVYLMRRLRGNTVVDTGHENTSVRPVDMAEAILNGKTALSGSFLEA